MSSTLVGCMHGRCNTTPPNGQQAPDIWPPSFQSKHGQRWLHDVVDGIDKADVVVVGFIILRLILQFRLRALRQVKM